MRFTRDEYIKGDIECDYKERLEYYVSAWSPYPNAAKNVESLFAVIDVGNPIKSTIESTTEAPPDTFYPDRVKYAAPFAGELDSELNAPDIYGLINSLVQQLKNSPPLKENVVSPVFLKEFTARLPEYAVENLNVVSVGGIPGATCNFNVLPVNSATLKFRWINGVTFQHALGGIVCDTPELLHSDSFPGSCTYISTIPEGPHMLTSTVGVLPAIETNINDDVYSFDVTQNVRSNRFLAPYSATEPTGDWNPYLFNSPDGMFNFYYAAIIGGIPKSVGGILDGAWPEELYEEIFLQGTGRAEYFFFPYIETGTIRAVEVSNVPLGVNVSTYSGDFNFINLTTDFISAESLGVDTLDELITALVGMGDLPNPDARIAVKFNVEYDAHFTYDSGNADFIGLEWNAPIVTTHAIIGEQETHTTNVEVSYWSDARTPITGGAPYRFVYPNEPGEMNPEDYQNWTMPPLRTPLRFQNYCRSFFNPFKKEK